MPRVARIVLPGLPHHVTQRGNNCQDVFLTDQDRQAYLDLLARQAGKYRLRVLGYCLMGNHVHLVVVPGDVDSLARGVGRTHFIYTQRFNRQHERVGHLWQARYYSCAFEEARLPLVLRYVEQNPVRAGLVGAAWEYPWSSAEVHSRGCGQTGFIDMDDWQKQSGGMDWREFLRLPQLGSGVDELRARTMTGRPWGGEGFLDRIERRLGVRLRARPVGRPRLENR